MSGILIREGAPQGASDPVPGLIAKFREIGAHMEAFQFEATPENKASWRCLEYSSTETLRLIETTPPTTGEGLAASLRFYRELRDKMFSVDDATWLETLAKAAPRLDLFAPDDAVNAALANCQQSRRDLEAARSGPVDPPESVLEPFYKALDAAEAVMARTKPRTVPGLALSAEWFVAYSEYAPSDDELDAWPETIAAALAEIMGART